MSGIYTINFFIRSTYKYTDLHLIRAVIFNLKNEISHVDVMGKLILSKLNINFDIQKNKGYNSKFMRSFFFKSLLNWSNKLV